ncbi:6-phosphogluconolactonase [Endozoicomonas sp. SM1973]|uniref:6-phosphogluconolactonase n=1 Tax=Spartinivicinus marinus TaxID=2994442 RepID=A0A853IGF2_9GAMM|nr:6-phosphogluconolactonase [Spartinivicinus marinus]MCX4027530.1 6-phosphogluconolactonase [Spartinivicinus marinus]NYZ68225.1 6-phosphogluconolactonase [Spartinivicinus marinus]
MKTQLNQLEALLNNKLANFDNAEQLTTALATDITKQLTKSIAEKGLATLVLSGGRTPIPLFKQLANTDIEWEKVYITLADERWVSPDDEASNERLIRQHLLQHQASKANFTGLKNHHDLATAGETECNNLIGKLPYPFDVVVLGMGNDGHTASLFPESTRLAEGLDPSNPNHCLAITPMHALHERMSLTFASLKQAKQIILHLCGTDKLNTLQTACEDGPIEDMPIRAFLRSQLPLTVYWSP